jgi:hypothetical protein
MGSRAPNDKGMKTLVYGTGKDRLLIFLSHGQINGIALKSKDHYC